MVLLNKYQKYKSKYLGLKIQIGASMPDVDLAKQIELIIRTNKANNKSSTSTLAQVLSLIMQKLGIPPSDYMIISSYCLHHIRPSSDLDVIVKPSGYSLLKESGLFVELEAKFTNESRLFKEFSELVTNPDQEIPSIEIFSKEGSQGFPSDDFALNHLQSTGKLIQDEYSNPYFDIETCVKLYSSVDKHDGKFYASGIILIPQSRVEKNIKLLEQIRDWYGPDSSIGKLINEKIADISQLLD